MSACQTCHEMVEISNWGGLLCRRMLGQELVPSIDRKQVALDTIAEWAKFQQNRKGSAEAAFLPIGKDEAGI